MLTSRPRSTTHVSRDNNNLKGQSWNRSVPEFFCLEGEYKWRVKKSQNTVLRIGTSSVISVFQPRFCVKRTINISNQSSLRSWENGRWPTVAPFESFKIYLKLCNFHRIQQPFECPFEGISLAPQHWDTVAKCFFGGNLQLNPRKNY